MIDSEFQRARSAQAKDVRTDAILQSAHDQAMARSVRQVTLTDIAAGVGMHKSTMLRYFETREEIFLRLAAIQWQAWAAAVSAELDAAQHPDEVETAGILAATLTDRPLFCDLLAQTPLNLERGVSLAAVKEFKLIALASAADVATRLGNVLPLTPVQARETVATATAMAGALWQMAAPGTTLRALYETDPELSHAVVDVEPRLRSILNALIRGYRVG